MPNPPAWAGAHVRAATQAQVLLNQRRLRAWRTGKFSFRLRYHLRAGFWLLLGVVGLWLAWIAPAWSRVDDQALPVAIAKPPQRLVSLLPALTEMVCALGQCDRLVGVDRYANFPQQVLALPKVGGGLDPDIEAVVALKPDLVLLATSAAGAVQRLQSLGIAVLALEPKTHADVRRTLAVLGQVLAVPDAQRVWRDVDAQLTQLAQRMPKRSVPLRVYVEVNNAPYAATEASFIGETLARLNVRNVVPAALGPFPKINPEFVVRADPDVILLTDSQSVDLAQRPGWSRLRAVQAQRVCAFTPAQSDVLVRPGPRMAEAARLMAQCLRDKAP